MIDGGESNLFVLLFPVPPPVQRSMDLDTQGFEQLCQYLTQAGEKYSVVKLPKLDEDEDTEKWVLTHIDKAVSGSILQLSPQVDSKKESIFTKVRHGRRHRARI